MFKGKHRKWSDSSIIMMTDVFFVHGNIEIPRTAFKKNSKSKLKT